MATLELDWAHEGDIDLEAKRIAAYLDIPVEVVTTNGPGGGWPVLRFTADRPTLAAILLGYDDSLDPDTVIIEDRELTYDEAEAAGFDGTGRDGDPRFPYHVSDAPGCTLCWLDFLSDQATNHAHEEGSRQALTADSDDGTWDADGNRT